MLVMLTAVSIFTGSAIAQGGPSAVSGGRAALVVGLAATGALLFGVAIGALPSGSRVNATPSSAGPRVLHGEIDVQARPSTAARPLAVTDDRKLEHGRREHERAGAAAAARREAETGATGQAASCAAATTTIVGASE